MASTSVLVFTVRLFCAAMTGAALGVAPSPSGCVKFSPAIPPLAQSTGKQGSEVCRSLKEQAPELKVFGTTRSLPAPKLEVRVSVVK